MIRITALLIPRGDESRARTLATLEIANDSTGDVETGNYIGTLHAEYTGTSGRRGRITGFHRRTQSVWTLVGGFLKLFGHTSLSPKLMEKLPPTNITLPDLPAMPDASDPPATPNHSRADALYDKYKDGHWSYTHLLSFSKEQTTLIYTIEEALDAQLAADEAHDTMLEFWSTPGRDNEQFRNLMLASNEASDHARSLRDILRASFPPSSIKDPVTSAPGPSEPAVETAPPADPASPPSGPAGI